MLLRSSQTKKLKKPNTPPSTNRDPWANAVVDSFEWSHTRGAFDIIPQLLEPIKDRMAQQAKLQPVIYGAAVDRAVGCRRR